MFKINIHVFYQGTKISKQAPKRQLKNCSSDYSIQYMRSARLSLLQDTHLDRDFEDWFQVFNVPEVKLESSGLSYSKTVFATAELKEVTTYCKHSAK
jgi:hypothetical protein